MEYCGPRGIRYTEFLDWPQIDQDAALAWARRDRSKCGGCGLPRDLLVDADGNVLQHPPFAPITWVCPTCEILESDQAERDQSNRPHRPGRSTRLMPVELVRKREAEREAALEAIALVREDLHP